tara:strand:+ start:447 stop:686 length:240 start_codon:yes stop_codon:yes gene_type:complete
MIKINIRKDDKITTKSFCNKIDLDNYVLDKIGTDHNIGNFTDCSNKIWNLNVGKSINVRNIIISVRSKSFDHNSMLGDK